MTASASTANDPILRVVDRCDRCHAQAWVIAKFGSGELMFCKHHFEKHELMIRELSYEIVDEREGLMKKSSA